MTALKSCNRFRTRSLWRLLVAVHPISKRKQTLKTRKQMNFQDGRECISKGIFRQISQTSYHHTTTDYFSWSIASELEQTWVYCPVIQKRRRVEKNVFAYQSWMAWSKSLKANTRQFSPDIRVYLQNPCILLFLEVFYWHLNRQPREPSDLNWVALTETARERRQRGWQKELDKVFEKSQNRMRRYSKIEDQRLSWRRRRRNWTSLNGKGLRHRIKLLHLTGLRR